MSLDPYHGGSAIDVTLEDQVSYRGWNRGSPCRSEGSQKMFSGYNKSQTEAGGVC